MGSFRVTMTKIAIPEHVTQWLEAIREEAYQKGIADATAAMVQAATSAAKHGINAVSPRAAEALAPPVRQGGGLVRLIPTRQRIISVVRANPGMRPTEIAQAIQKADPSVNRNTILTAIKRMKKNDLRARGPKLYLAEQSQEEAA